MDPDDAAKKWVEANPDKVEAWLEQLTPNSPRAPVGLTRPGGGAC